MKAQKIMADVYVLLGDTLQEANAMVASTSQEEAMLMWHRKLGYKSEQNLQIQAERNLLLGLKKVVLPLCEHYVVSQQT